MALYTRRDHERAMQNDVSEDEDDADTPTQPSALEIAMLKKKAKALKKARKKAAAQASLDAAGPSTSATVDIGPTEANKSPGSPHPDSLPTFPSPCPSSQVDILTASSAWLAFPRGSSSNTDQGPFDIQDPLPSSTAQDSSSVPSNPSLLPSPVRGIASHIISAAQSLFASPPPDEDTPFDNEDDNCENYPLDDVDVPCDSPSQSPPFSQSFAHSLPSTLPIPDGPQTPEEPPISTREALALATDVWFWQPLMLLFGWLHLNYHVSHRAIQVIISIFRLVLKALGALTDDSDIPRTLRTTFNRLGLSDRFFVAPMCPACFRVYPADSVNTLACSHCNIPLFKGKNILETDPSSDLFVWHTGSATVRIPKPVLQTPMRLPSSMLAELIHRTPTMERELDSWRSLPPDPDRLRCVQDGAIWRTILGPDNSPFFDNSDERQNRDELRLGVTLGFDGCVQHTSHTLIFSLILSFKGLALREVHSQENIARVRFRFVSKT